MDNNYRDYSKSRNKPQSNSSVPRRTSSSGNSSSTTKELQYTEYRNTHAHSGTSRSQSAASIRRKRKKQQKTIITISFFSVIVLLIVTCVIVINASRKEKNTQQITYLDPATDIIKEGVSINNIDVSGLRIDEARNVVLPGIQQDINKINIKLTGEGFSESITGEQLEATSNIESILSEALAGPSNSQYATTISLDYDALKSCIQEINAGFAHGSTDAAFTLKINDNGKPEINYIEGQPGQGVDIEETERLIKEALESGNYTAEIEPAITTVQPSMTVADLKAQVSEIGRYSTTFCKKLPSSDPEENRITIENRSFNIIKCADIINGEVVNPGKTWSFNKTVGDRNEKNGWKEAKGIYGGETYNMQYGGGVCQVSTTLYVALMRAGIPYANISRRHHSIPSTYVDKGLDATVDSGHIDFKFKNVTGYPIYIFAYTTPTKNRSRYLDLNVVIYGRALPEGVKYDMRSEIKEEILQGEPIITYSKKQFVDYQVVTVEGRNGYVVDVYLDKYENGKVTSSEFLYTDEYEPIAEKITMGTLTPSPEPESTPDVSYGSNDSSDDLP